MNLVHSDQANSRSWFKNNIWTAVGMFCLTLTLLSNVDNYLSAAKWAHYLVDQWTQIITTIWRHALFFLPHISGLDANLLTITSLIVGAAIRSMNKSSEKSKIVVFDVVVLLITFIAFSLIFQQKVYMAYLIEKSFSSLEDTTTSIHSCLIKLEKNVIEKKKEFIDRIRNMPAENIAQQSDNIIQAERIFDESLKSIHMVTNTVSTKSAFVNATRHFYGYFLYLRNVIFSRRELECANDGSNLTYRENLPPGDLQDELRYLLKGITEALSPLGTSTISARPQESKSSFYDWLATASVLTIILAVFCLPFILIWFIARYKPDISKMSRHLLAALLMVVSVVAISHAGTLLQDLVQRTNFPQVNEN